MARKHGAKLTILLLLSGAAAARADSGFAIETYQPAPAGDRFFAVPDADLPERQEPAFGAQLGFVHEPLVLRLAGQPIANGRLVQDQFVLRLGASLPLFERLLLDADLDMSAWQHGQTPFNGQAALSAAAFSDPRIGARFALFQRESLSVAAGLSVWLPLGSQANYGSDGSLRALPQVLVSGSRGRLAWASEAGLELRRAIDSMFTRSGSAAKLSAAAGLTFLEGKLQIGPEVYSRIQFNQARNSSLEALLGARLTRGNLTFGAGVGSRLIEDAPGAAPLRIIAQISYSGLDWMGSSRSHSRGLAPLQRPAQLVVEPAFRPAAAPAPLEPALAQAVAVLEPELARVETGQVELREPVKFAHDSAELLAESQPVLAAAAAALAAHPELTAVVIQGHSDNHGPVRRNFDLTVRRATAVRAWLIQHSIASSRLVAVGCGSVSPIASNETEEGRAENRRVELRLGLDQVGSACKR